MKHIFSRLIEQRHRTIGAMLAKVVIVAILVSPMPLLASTDVTTIYLVRHAEKAATKPDPELSQAGLQRAQALAKTLRDVPLSKIYSTAYKRTMQTAHPTASQQGLTIVNYDPRQLAEFAEQLKQHGGNILVVGHSNTTPELVKLLGGEPGKEIAEKTEFDRLYIIQASNAGLKSSILLRYGN